MIISTSSIGTVAVTC